MSLNSGTNTFDFHSGLDDQRSVEDRRLETDGYKAIRTKYMAHLGGESSNTLFDILAQWNEVLKSIQTPANDPNRDICGVAG
jgi:hypothetical protein